MPHLGSRPCPSNVRHWHSHNAEQEMIVSNGQDGKAALSKPPLHWPPKPHFRPCTSVAQNYLLGCSKHGRGAWTRQDRIKHLHILTLVVPCTETTTRRSRHTQRKKV